MHSNVSRFQGSYLACTLWFLFVAWLQDSIWSHYPLNNWNRCSLPSPGERGAGRRQHLSPVQADREGQGRSGLSSLPFPRRVLCLWVVLLVLGFFRLVFFVFVFFFGVFLGFLGFFSWNINLLGRCRLCCGNVSLHWYRAHSSCPVWPSSVPRTVGHVWVLGNLCAKVWKIQLGRWVWCTLRPQRNWLS